MNGLMLHSGANAATREDVLSAPTPPNTDTHYPIPHATLLGGVQDALEATGWETTQEEFGMWNDGNRMFALMALAPADEITAPVDYQMTVGIRNSHDKAFAAGLALGSRVFVCDNLCFSGEITVARKHTKRILADLDRLVAEAFGKLMEQRVLQEQRIDTYRLAEFNDAQVHDFLIRSVDAKVMSNAGIAKVLKEWREPQHEEFQARTAWTLMNAYTETFKGVNPFDLTARTTRLHGLLDLETGVGIDVIEQVQEVFPNYAIVEEPMELEGERNRRLLGIN